jgi:dTDP-6-deoxy-L-talose 4-dehydrogenase (NAD+)
MIKSVAITGASGFIGHHVLDALLQYDLEIVAVTRDAGSLKNYSQRIKVIEFDIANTQENVFDRLGCPDMLIHLAWDGLPNYKSLSHFELELPRQYHFLRAMIDGGLKSLVVTGTCFEYGMQSGCLSEDLPALPSNPYGYAKDALRKQLEFLKVIKPFNLTWARLFYVFGRGQSKTSIYTQLNEAVLRGDRTFNMSGGAQLRDYLPIEEVASLIVRLALLNKNLGVVNLSSGKPISVRKLVESWIKENHWDIEPNLGFYPYPDYEPIEFWGDNNLLKAALREK